MRRLFKRACALIPALALVLSLTACGGGGVSAFDATKYIQGLLDKTYLGEFDEYMKVVDITENECEDDYISGLESEAEYFASVFQIDNLTDDIKADIVDLYKEIYSYSKYTVSAATKQDDKTYSVKVTVEPIDIFHLVADTLNGGAADDFNAQYDDVDVASMSDDEYDTFYAAYDAAWAQLIIDLTREKLPELGYLDSSSLLVQVAEDEDGLWGIPQSDFDNLDWLIIDYNF